MFRPAWPLVVIYSNNAQDGCQPIGMAERYGRCNWQQFYFSLRKSSKTWKWHEYI